MSPRQPLVEGHSRPDGLHGSAAASCTAGMPPWRSSRLDRTGTGSSASTCMPAYPWRSMFRASGPSGPRRSAAAGRDQDQRETQHRKEQGHRTTAARGRSTRYGPRAFEQPVGVTEQSDEETSAAMPPTPAATPSDAAAIAPSATAIALPPTTLLTTATTVAKVKNCLRRSGGTAAFSNTPSPVVVP